MNRWIACLLAATLLSCSVSAKDTEAPAITEFEQLKVDNAISELGRIDAEIRVRQNEIALLQAEQRARQQAVPPLLDSIMTAHKLDKALWDWEKDGAGNLITKPLKFAKKIKSPEPPKK